MNSTYLTCPCFSCDLFNIQLFLNSQEFTPITEENLSESKVTDNGIPTLSNLDTLLTPSLFPSNFDFLSVLLSEPILHLEEDFFASSSSKNLNSQDILSSKKRKYQQINQQIDFFLNKQNIFESPKQAKRKKNKTPESLTGNSPLLSPQPISFQTFDIDKATVDSCLKYEEFKKMINIQKRLYDSQEAQQLKLEDEVKKQRNDVHTLQNRIKNLNRHLREIHNKSI